MLKLLHDACHNISSLVICFWSVKSILFLFKSEAEVFVGIPICEWCLHCWWVIPSGTVAHSLPARQDFSQRLLPSYSEPHCLVLRRATKKRNISKEKVSPYFFYPWWESRLFACCCPQGVGRRWWLGKLLWEPSRLLPWVWMLLKALGSRVLPPDCYPNVVVLSVPNLAKMVLT